MSWVVMEAPTGHRFCVGQVSTSDFEARANNLGSMIEALGLEFLR